MAKEKYVSRRYLREKWEKLKWDMEKTLGLESSKEDKVAKKDVERCEYNIKLMMESILTELGIEDDT